MYILVVIVSPITYHTVVCNLATIWHLWKATNCYQYRNKCSCLPRTSAAPWTSSFPHNLCYSVSHPLLTPWCLELPPTLSLSSRIMISPNSTNARTNQTTSSTFWTRMKTKINRVLRHHKAEITQLLTRLSSWNIGIGWNSWTIFSETFTGNSIFVSDNYFSVIFTFLGDKIWPCVDVLLALISCYYHTHV